MLFPYHDDLKSVTAYIKMGDNRTLRLYKKRHKMPTCTLRARRSQKLFNLYENLPVQTKMAILLWILILLAILLHEQFIHYTHINLCPNK